MTKKKLVKLLGNHLVKTKYIGFFHWRAQGNAIPENYPDWGYSCGGMTEKMALRELYNTLIRHGVLSAIESIEC